MVIGVNARLLYSEMLEGIQRYIYETTLEMAREHPEDQFYLYFDRTPPSALYFPDNVTRKIIYLPTRHPVLWKIWFDWLLPLQLKKDKVDVLYSGDGFISLRTNIPQVMVTHDLAYLYYPSQISSSILNYYKKRIPKFHQKAHHIIAVSEYTKQDIQVSFNIKDENISVAYNAIHENPDLLPEASDGFKKKIQNLSPYFCYVGAIHPRKNLINVCLAFQKFKSTADHQVNLVLAGRMAWMTDDIETIIKENDDIIYLGTITEQEKKHLMTHSLALCYLSLFEGFGIPILEGFNAETMVITSNTSSMPEVAGEAALLVNPMDIQKIAEAFETAMDAEVRKRYVEKGKLRINDFSWKKSGKTIYDCLKKN